MDTSGYEQADLGENEYFWENPQMEMDAVLTPGIGTPFSSAISNNLELEGGGSSENPIKFVEDDDKKISPPTTPVCDRPTGSHVLLGTFFDGLTTSRICL